jgi:hypothetical protein
MAFLATEHGAKVVARFSFGEQWWSNHIWARRPDFDEADMLALVNAVKAQYVSVLINEFTVSQAMETFKCYDMRSIDGAVVDDTTGRVPGTGGTMEMPPNNCCVLTLYTAKRGRAHRGRLYMGPFNEESMGDGEWIEALVDDVEEVGTRLLAEIGNVGWDWGVRSGQLDGVPRDPAIITPITSSVVRSPRMGSQRRRVDRI